ncbi:hypothetical protein Tco_0245803 [Tanacetum coccineum]
MLAYTPVNLNLPNLNESFTASQVNEYAEFDFDNPENDSLSDMVKTGEEEIHLDGLETVDQFVQTPEKQNFELQMNILRKCQCMLLYEVNVVNENQPPSSEKVVGQLMRKRFVGKARVEPYTVQPPTTAPSAFLKVDRKGLKRKARLLHYTKHTNFFDDDVGEHKLKKKRNKKVHNQSKPNSFEKILVDFSRICCPSAPYSDKLMSNCLGCLVMVYDFREHERMILDSVLNGPPVWPTITQEDGTTRQKTYVELSATKNIQAYCDVKAVNIVLQGLPPDVYAIVNHHKVAKEIWDRVKLLIQGASLWDYALTIGNICSRQAMSRDVITVGIVNGEHPLLVVAQVSLAGTTPNAAPTLKDPKFWTAEEKNN